MPATVDARLTDAQLAEIRDRLTAGLNDDGLKAWYPSDVASLLREVLMQRRIIAQSLAVCRDNPALESDTTDLIAACQEIRERWNDLRRNVWARAEVKKLREQNDQRDVAIQRLQQELTEAMARADALHAAVDQVNARMVDTIAEARQREAHLRREQAEKLARVDALLTQAASTLRD